MIETEIETISSQSAMHFRKSSLHQSDKNKKKETEMPFDAFFFKFSLKIIQYTARSTRNI